MAERGGRLRGRRAELGICLWGTLFVDGDCNYLVSGEACVYGDSFAMIDLYIGKTYSYVRRRLKGGVQSWELVHRGIFCCWTVYLKDQLLLLLLLLLVVVVVVCGLLRALVSSYKLEYSAFFLTGRNALIPF